MVRPLVIHVARFLVYCDRVAFFVTAQLRPFDSAELAAYLNSLPYRLMVSELERIEREAKVYSVPVFLEPTAFAFGSERGSAPGLGGCSLPRTIPGSTERACWRRRWPKWRGRTGLPERSTGFD